MEQFLIAHQAVILSCVTTGAVSHALGIVADSMDPPTPTDGHGYKSLYKFLQLVAANYSKAK